MCNVQASVELGPGEVSSFQRVHVHGLGFSDWLQLESYGNLCSVVIN